MTRPAVDTVEAKFIVPKKTNDAGTVLRTIGRMLTDYPYYDISWLVAYVFTWGSIVWVGGQTTVMLVANAHEIAGHQCILRLASIRAAIN